MEENINDSSANEEEKRISNPSVVEPLVPADEILNPPTGKAEIINPPSEIKDMEVHHHAHDPAAPHHKKNWKSYFWEFLMLFLAVFCGFLAEYQLEHKIEKDRENQYMKSMVEDLKTDSIRIARTIDNTTRQVLGFDSLLKNIYHTPNTDSSIRTLYYLKETYTLTRYTMYFSKATISQLKNSGSLRLIRKRAVADSIISYDIASERIESQGEGVDFAGKKLLDLSVKIFDGEFVLDYNSSSNYKEILSSNKKFILLSDNEKLLREYANLAKFKKDVIINYLRQLTSLKSRIPIIIEFLKKEYHLE